MRRWAWRTGSALIVVLALTACDRFSRIGEGPEARINAAYPLSPAAEAAKAALLTMLQGSAPEHSRFEAELASRLKMRALTCGKGLQVGMFTSAPEIRERIGDPTCFKQIDATLTRWLGMRRATAMLRQPPLRPIPQAPSSFLVAGENISDVRVAREAGIALVDTLNYLHVFDLASSNPIFSDKRPAGNSVVAALSPNGRLFFYGEGGMVKVRDSETGAVLFEQPGSAAWSAAWLDDRTILIGQGTASHKPILLDLESGNEMPVPGSQDMFTAVLPLGAPSGAPPRFALLGFRTVCVIELARSESAVEPRLVDERPKRAGTTTFNTSGWTADAARFFFSNQDLTIVQLDSLGVETISFAPLLLQGAVALSDPDKILIKGYTMATQGQPQRVYVYSLKEKTLASVDWKNLLSERFVYLAPINRLAVIAGAKIALLRADLETQPALKIEAVQSALLDEANQRKLAEFERKLEQTDSVGRRDNPVVAPYPGPIADLARNALVEAVGVYQGSGSAHRPGEARRVGMVDVRVRQSARPLVLVLSSYEPVRWNLISEGGARIAAILVASYYPSTVVGAGNARLIQLGQLYAYERSSPAFMRLEQEVARQTGQRIGVFQGRYEGLSFAVGGT